MACWPRGKVSSACGAAIASHRGSVVRVLQRGLPTHGGLLQWGGRAGESSLCCFISPSTF